MSAALEYVFRICEQILLERCRGTDSDHVGFEEVVRLQRGFEDAARASGVAAIAKAFNLSWHEQVTLWMCAATQIDRVIKSLFAKAMGEATCHTSISNLRHAVYGRQTSARAWRELSANGTLQCYGLLEPQQDGNDDSPLQVPPAVMARLHDVIPIPEVCRGVAFGRAVPFDSLIVHPSSAAELRQAPQDLDQSYCVLVHGRVGLGSRTIAVSFASSRGHEVIQVECRHLAKQCAELSRQLRGIARECVLENRCVVFDEVDLLGADPERWACFALSLDLFAGPVFAASHSELPALPGNRTVLEVLLRAPETQRLADCWQASLDQGTREDAVLLASAYPMAPALITRAAQAAKAIAGDGNALQPEHVFAGIRSVLDDQLSKYAKRITVTQGWTDIVLPADQLAAVTDLAARIRERHKVYETWGFGPKIGKGLGVTALFSGPPGTGKTMIAQLLAKELGLELYQVDLAKLVSKWIGETEKNLAAVFDAAEACFAVLLFDEADALFGKRTDVKSSNDRYANFETNYLLQRLESYSGICLLTTNHESNMDPAFQRRLSLHLRFVMPDVEERKALWTRLIPAAAPVEANLDLEGLARRFVMSGGYIKNATVRAAFMAAAEGRSIANAHLERAARLEYEAMGKIV